MNTTSWITTEELLDKLNAFDMSNQDGLNWWEDLAEEYADTSLTWAAYNLDETAFVAQTAEGLRRIEARGAEWRDEGEYY